MRTTAALLAYSAALAFGLYVMFEPTFGSGFASVQTERGDGMLNHYILEHTWQSVSNPAYRGTLFSPPCFYPEPLTLWYSEHFFGVAPVYWGLRLAGVPYDFAFQWWQIILTALNFVAFALVLRWLRTPHTVAVLGGYLWAFGLVHFEQMKHQQMIPRFCMALAAYHAWRFVLALSGSAERGAGGGEQNAAGADGPPGSRDALRHLNRMLAAVFVQAITCVNTGWFLVSGLGTFLPLALTLRAGGWRNLYRLVRENRGRVAAIVVGWLVALLVAYSPYFYVNWGQGRAYYESNGLMPTPSAWLTAQPGTPWSETTAPYRDKVIDECWLFCGFGVYVLGVVAFGCVLASLFRNGCRPEYVMALAALLAAAAWVALTITDKNDVPIKPGTVDPMPWELRPGHSLWEVVRLVPGSRAIRCVSRVYVVVYLFGLLGSLVWLAHATERLRPAVRAVLLVLVAAGCVAEQQKYKPASFAKSDFYAIADRTAVELRKGDIAYVRPHYTDSKGVMSYWVYGEVMAMWVGMRANVPVVNGYSGRVPHETHPTLEEASEEMLRRWLAGKFRGTVAVVDPDDLDATVVIVIE